MPHQSNLGEEMRKLGLLSTTLTFIALIELAGCASSFISESPGSVHVAVSDSKSVSSCLSKGSIDVSVLDHVWFYHRDQDAIDANLQQLARNSAIDSGADTIVPGDRKGTGDRSFLLYKCGR